MPNPDPKMTELDAEVAALDEAIQDVVLSHQWEMTDGLEFNPACDVLLRCSCGNWVVVVRRAELLAALLQDPFDTKRARRAHQGHLMEILAARLRLLCSSAFLPPEARA